MAGEKILIVDDEKLLRWSLRKKCEDWGYAVVEAEDGTSALRIAHVESPDLVLLDVHLPDLNGVQVLEKLKESGEVRAVIMITADPQLDDVKTAIRLGAFDFIGKPLNFDELSVTIENALETRRLRTEVESLKGEARRQAGPHEVIANSAKMAELMQFVRKVAASEATTILIQGESGSGKDLIARAIHYGSRRQDKPFVAVNCSAIPETLMEAELFGHEKGAFTDAKAMKRGLFEAAHGGTLFLDEIGELPAVLQAKLLRVLEDQRVRRVGGVRDVQVDVRVVAASNRDLERAVRDGHFRQDLYYRLAIISIFIPPLRDHQEDILPLVEHFIGHYNRMFRKSIRGLAEPARRLLLSYAWPGNVRELRNAIERAMILEDGPDLQAAGLPFPVSHPSALGTAFEQLSSLAPGTASTSVADLPDGRKLPSLSLPDTGTSLEEIERAMVVLALERTNQKQTQAARLLDISRDALRYKMKKFGLMSSDSAEEDAAPDLHVQVSPNSG
jgi:two-component system, NtrC family, response regulator AtoC